MYSYLLGIHLGAGCLVRTGVTAWRMVVVLDVMYPGVIDEVGTAMRAIGGGAVVTRDRPGAKCLESSSPVWRLAFPQHGPGRKHLRRIELVD